jgi:hypothetical protein
MKAKQKACHGLILNKNGPFVIPVSPFCHSRAGGNPKIDKNQEWAPVFQRRRQKGMRVILTVHFTSFSVKAGSILFHSFEWQKHLV